MLRRKFKLYYFHGSWILYQWKNVVINLGSRPRVSKVNGVSSLPALLTTELNHIRKSHLSNVPLGIWGAVWSMPSGTGYTPDKPTTTGYSSSLIIFRLASRKSSLLGKSRSRVVFSLSFSIFISIFVVVVAVVIVNNDGELECRIVHVKSHYKMSTSCLALYYYK